MTLCTFRSRRSSDLSPEHDVRHNGKKAASGVLWAKSAERVIMMERVSNGSLLFAQATVTNVFSRDAPEGVVETATLDGCVVAWGGRGRRALTVQLESLVRLSLLAVWDKVLSFLGRAPDMVHRMSHIEIVYPAPIGDLNQPDSSPRQVCQDSRYARTGRVGYRYRYLVARRLVFFCKKS